MTVKTVFGSGEDLSTTIMRGVAARTVILTAAACAAAWEAVISRKLLTPILAVMTHSTLFTLGTAATGAVWGVG